MLGHDVEYRTSVVQQMGFCCRLVLPLTGIALGRSFHKSGLLLDNEAVKPLLLVGGGQLGREDDEVGKVFRIAPDTRPRLPRLLLEP